MLLEARKIPWLERAYAAYGRRLLRRAFARVWVGGVAWPAGEGPALAYLNHPAWWDPILAVFLSRDVAHGDGYGPMDGVQLQRFPFFRRVGCFGTTTDGVEDARALALYAARLLHDGPRRTLWIFAQGGLEPARAPLRFRSGLARLSRAVPDAPLIPIAVRYEQRDQQRPEIFVRIGAPSRASTRPESPAAHTRRLVRRLADELARLDADLATNDLHDYRVVLGGRRSVSDRYEAIASLVRR
jgi:1-acyl-sn-glycerol-3-phosphate acyltransferase